MIHTQSAVHCMVELARQHKFDPGKVVSIEADVIRMAYDFAGGENFYGVDKGVRTKEQADHNLPYLLAVAMLDGDVMPAQFEPDRIARADVQQLLKKYRCGQTRNSPGTVSRQDARQGHGAATGWQGDRARGSGFSRPRFPSVHLGGIRVEKFDRLVAGRLEEGLCREIKDAVRSLENIRGQRFDETARLRQGRQADRSAEGKSASDSKVQFPQSALGVGARR